MVDRYTKIVLTVIAAALVGILARFTVGPSIAESGGVTRFSICDSPAATTSGGCARVLDGRLHVRNLPEPTR